MVALRGGVLAQGAYDPRLKETKKTGRKGRREEGRKEREGGREEGREGGGEGGREGGRKKEAKKEERKQRKPIHLDPRIKTCPYCLGLCGLVSRLKKTNP